MLSFICLALLPVAFAAIPESANDCKANFDQVLQNFDATKDDKCKALVVFSKCLSEFPKNNLMESEVFTQNEKRCEAAWKATGQPEMRTRRGNFQLTVDDAKQVTFFRHRREEINVFDMNAAITDLKMEMATMKALVTRTKTDVDAKVTADIKKLQEATTIGIKVATDAAASAKSDVAAAVKKVTTDVAGSISKAATATTTKLNAAASSTDGKLAALKKTIPDAKALAISAVEKPIHMWSGGPKAHKRSTGWHDMDYSRIDFETAAPYFKRLSNTRFVALQDGIFEFSANTMGHSNGRNWMQFQFYVNGKNINGGQHVYAYSWKQVEFKIVWLIKKNQQFYCRMYNGGGGNEYTWHSSPNWHDQHSRIQVTYKGKLAGAITGAKCTSATGGGKLC